MNSRALGVGEQIPSQGLVGMITIPVVRRFHKVERRMVMYTTEANPDIYEEKRRCKLTKGTGR